MECVTSLVAMIRNMRRLSDAPDRWKNLLVSGEFRPSTWGWLKSLAINKRIAGGEVVVECNKISRIKTVDEEKEKGRS